MLPATRWKHQSLHFQLQKRATCLAALSACENLKIGKQVSVCRRYTAAIRMPPAFAMFHRALPATSWKHRSLRFQVEKRATLPRRPLRLKTIKDQQTGLCLPIVKCCHSHAPFICYVVMRASSNALEASVPVFAAVKEGDVVSSPSPLVKSKRSANRYLFAVGNPHPFASPVHLLCCNERFHQRAGSINPRVFSFKRGRRCLVAFSICKHLKIGKQAFCLPLVKCYRSHPLCIYRVAMSASSNEPETSIAAFSITKEGDVASSLYPLENNQRSANRSLLADSKVLPFACPLHLLCCNEGFHQQARNTNRRICTCAKGQSFPIALSATNKRKIASR